MIRTHRVSKRNAFGVSVAIGLGFTIAKLLSLMLLSGVMYAMQAWFVR